MLKYSVIINNCHHRTDILFEQQNANAVQSYAWLAWEKALISTSVLTAPNLRPKCELHIIRLYVKGVQKKPNALHFGV